MLRCRSCTATFAFLECGSHFTKSCAAAQAKNCSATLTKLRCKKVALSCRFPADFKLPRLGTHVEDLLKFPVISFYAEALFGALLRPFALLRLHSFALICVLYFQPYKFRNVSRMAPRVGLEPPPPPSPKKHKKGGRS